MQSGEASRGLAACGFKAEPSGGWSIALGIATPTLVDIIGQV